MTKASGKADSVSHPSFAEAFRFWVKLGFDAKHHLVLVTAAGFDVRPVL
jgi:hypothetical protein